jgi:hypothetical protein
MSTKTTFKRIALVAVAALGLGVLSVAPSSAQVSGLTVTATNGTSTIQTGTTGGTSDTTTAATLSLTALVNSASDSVTISVVTKSVPADASRVALLGFLETNTTSGWAKTQVDDSTTMAADLANAGRYDSETIASANYTMNGNGAGYIGAKFTVQLESGTGTTKAGDYVYTAIIRSYSYDSGAWTVATTTKDLTITVAALAAASEVASATYSTLGEPSATSVLATASATARATLLVTLKNAANATAALESVTATISGPGTIGVAGGAVGKSVVLQYTSALTLSVYADGTAGTSTVTVSTPSVTFPTKTITFYAATASTSVASTAKSVIEASGTSTSDVVRTTIKDSLGNLWSGDAYIYATSAASALIAGSETPALCSFDTVDLRHECAVTGKLVGTAKFKVIDASTVAAATLTSNEVEVRVAVATPASFSLKFDKPTYAPGDKAILSVVLLDANGAQIVGKDYTDALAAGGITPSVAFGSSSDTLTATTVKISATSSSTSGTTAGQQNYVVYMPFASGDVVVTATGGTGLPLAARVAKTATATVVNSSVDAATDAANEATDAANAATDAALAAADAADAATAAAQDASDAVAALSASVSKLISSLRAQITSLTNLVIKIQKKVKA